MLFVPELSVALEGTRLAYCRRAFIQSCMHGERQGSPIVVVQPCVSSPSRYSHSVCIGPNSLRLVCWWPLTVHI